MRTYHPQSWSQQAREMADNMFNNVIYYTYTHPEKWPDIMVSNLLPTSFNSREGGRSFWKIVKRIQKKEKYKLGCKIKKLLV